MGRARSKEPEPVTRSRQDPYTSIDKPSLPTASSKPLLPHSSTSDLRERFAEIRATTAPTTPMGSASSIWTAPVPSPTKRTRSGANRGAHDSSSSNGNNKKMKMAVNDAKGSTDEDIDSSDEERPVIGVGTSEGLGAGMKSVEAVTGHKMNDISRSSFEPALRVAAPADVNTVKSTTNPLIIDKAPISRWADFDSSPDASPSLEPTVPSSKSPVKEPKEPIAPIPSQLPTPVTPSKPWLKSGQGNAQSPAAPLTPGGRRTAAEIEARRQDALARKQKNSAIARELSNTRYGQRQLESYGLNVSAAGTTYGNGRGGIKLEKGVDGEEAPKEWIPNPACSEEQLEVLKQVEAGGNVFFTGSAGVGKSFLLKEIRRLLEHLCRPFQVTATTGIAALEINGSTLHSFAGLGLCDEPIQVLYDKLMRSKAKENWKSVKTLIIDEISMIDPDFFTKLSTMGKLIRENNRAFGGIQLIVSGDFFQLPPVPSKVPKCIRCGGEFVRTIDPATSTLAYQQLPEGMQPYKIGRCSDATRGHEKEPGCGFQVRFRRFVFECESWHECNFKVMELTRVFRQTDVKFIGMLEKFRRGICDQECVEILNDCGTALRGEMKIKPTNLYPIRASVQTENESEYKKLNEKPYHFTARDSSRGPRAKDLLKTHLKDISAEITLNLKKGAQVILLANIDVSGGLVNGSRGVLVDWIDAAEVDKAANGMQADPNSKKKGGQFGGEEWKSQASSEWLQEQEEAKFPIVLFATGVTTVIRPHTWCRDVDKLNSVARTQLPIGLAWAMTIHKSQGQSLDVVRVKLTNTFEKGQAYVALSRCRTSAGMQVEGFRPNLIMADPTVIKFYERLALKKPFFGTPCLPVNPLLYFPGYSPVCDRLTAIFGKIPDPLPVGSALAPSKVQNQRASVVQTGSPVASNTSSEKETPVSKEPPTPLLPFQPLRPAAHARLPPQSAPEAQSQDLLDQAARSLIRSGTTNVEDFLRQARMKFFNALKDGTTTPVASTSTAASSSTEASSLSRNLTASQEGILSEAAAQGIFDEEHEDTIMASQMLENSSDMSESGSTLSETQFSEAQVQGTAAVPLGGMMGEDKKVKLKKSRKRSKRVGG